MGVAKGSEWRIIASTIMRVHDAGGSRAAVHGELDLNMTCNSATHRFLSADERHRKGKALRKRVGRSEHAALTIDGRDAIGLLMKQDSDRHPPLLAVRYGRMLASPFAFLRGAAAIMAHDLAPTPRVDHLVQACGDCHLLNFGAFVSVEGRLVFDLNDFDETLAAPWEWDVKRLAASVWVAGRYAQWRERQCREATLACVGAYRERIAACAQTAAIEVWATPLDAAPLVALCVKSKASTAALERRALHSGARKLPATAEHDGERRMVDRPPLVYHSKNADAAKDTMHEAFRHYAASLPAERRVLFDRYRLADVAVKIVGVGSVGRFCMIALFEDGVGASLFLQVKQAARSVLADHVSQQQVYAHQGERVVRGQRLAQSTPDSLLGWSTVGGPPVDFYVRRLREVKLEIALETLRADDFATYARYCGTALAHAHARSGDAALISGYLGASDAFDQALGEFARAYADQTEKDHAALEDAVLTGRVVASCER